jgi:nitroreductase
MPDGGRDERDTRSSRLALVHAYHDGTKHHFHAFARSLGYLDWATQPNPFRSFAGARSFPLAPAPGAFPARLPVGPVLRAALGLTAWKVFGQSRWSLRANPSSGNLHPTEAYVACGPGVIDAERAIVAHYAPDRHALELRCTFEGSQSADVLIVALTSIHWREAWKYGERAFRYCQHDLGHAIAAVAIAASLEGWNTRLLPEWSSQDVGTLTGANRDADYANAEREEPACVLALARGRPASVDRGALLAALDRGVWSGRASRLSTDHVPWTFIDEIAAATSIGRLERPLPIDAQAGDDRYSRALILRRRSAVAFDGQSTLPCTQLFDILRQTLPGSSPLWRTIWWTPRIHLALFVHRVDGLAPGLYLFERDSASGERLRRALGRDFQPERVVDSLPLFGLAQGDCRRLAERVSCNQDIAADGFFSLGMIADFDASLEEFGPPFYRHLFWEAGFVGQVLYLEAERVGARATGIGCFYDDPVHDILGLTGHAFQSLYHFTVGVPVDDPRLTTSAGYDWEQI